MGLTATILAGSKAAIAYAVPTLMSTFATVTPAGSIMPLWLPAIQSFAATSVMAASAPAVAGAGGVAAGMIYYFAK